MDNVNQNLDIKPVLCIQCFSLLYGRVILSSRSKSNTLERRTGIIQFAHYQLGGMKYNFPLKPYVVILCSSNFPGRTNLGSFLGCPIASCGTSFSNHVSFRVQKQFFLRCVFTQFLCVFAQGSQWQIILSHARLCEPERLCAVGETFYQFCITTSHFYSTILFRFTQRSSPCPLHLLKSITFPWKSSPTEGVVAYLLEW